MTSSSPHQNIRSITHYTASVLIMGIYGGQVCPLVDTISMPYWFLELTIIFSLFYGVRYFIEKHLMNKTPYRKRPMVQFQFDLFLSLMIGLTITLINNWVYHFPHIESGLKMIFGATALGFFMAVDMSMERERHTISELTQTHQALILDQNFFPMTRKFAIVATTTSIIISTVILLVVLKDLGWMSNVSTVDAGAARISIIKEILFITIIFLIHIFNIILSYAKNLKISVDNENTVLTHVANGHLDNHVVVGTNDEFGIMAQYTNLMIDKLSQKTQQVRQTRDVTIMALASLAETRDNETGDHILRTQHYVKALALHLKDHPKFKDFLDKDTIDLFYKSAPLHDIGKVGVPDSILLKPGKLDFDEFEIMKKHTTYGKEALEKASRNLEISNFLMIAKEIAYSHHEKWDGSGYPLGLKGEEIPLAGRLMAIADVYDALISKRVYKDAFSHEKAMSIIKDGKGSHFDPDVYDAFVEIETQIIATAKEFGE